MEIIGSICFGVGGDPIKSVKVERIQCRDDSWNSQLDTAGKVYKIWIILPEQVLSVRLTYP